MSKRTNGTNRAATALNVSRYTGKLMPKKKSPPAATGQAQVLKNKLYP